MPVKKIFLSLDIQEIAVELLQNEGFEVTVWKQDRPMTQAELIAEAKKYDALLCTSIDQIDATFLQKCKHLDIISQYAAGYNNIDIAEATRLGIPIGYAPGAMNDATADTAFGLMIAVSRKMFYLHKTIERGEWSSFKPKANLGIELKNKTLGIFGLGRIGMEMAKRCKGAYDMDIIYHNRMPNKEAEKLLHAKWVTFEALLAQSDVLSVHSALNETTKGIFNKTAFDQMQPSAIFINTSRGGVHQEADLIKALQNKKIWGAGLDVTDPEPMASDNPLLFMENVAVLPHIGSATIEARTEMARLAAMNIIEFYKYHSVPNIVNAEVMIRN